MNKFKIFTSFIVAIIFLFLLTSKVLAADLNIDCSETGCTGAENPLFSTDRDGFWYPGKTLTKTINLKNSSPQIREMAIRGERITPSINILEDVMHISIVGGATVIWSGSVADFYGQDKIGMGIFDPGANLDYNFKVSMDIGADDNYQNQETVFDLTLGFWGEPIPTPTPTPIPTITPTIDTKKSVVITTSTAITGTVLGTGVSAATCSDTEPGLPTNFTAAAGPGNDQVTLSWTPPTTPYTYFLIAYSDNPNSPKWGNPNIDTGAVSYTVSGLGGDTYWFWLRAGNGCMPGDFVSPTNPLTIGGVPGPVAPGFEEGILGEKTPGELGEGTATETGEVAGVGTKPFKFWWLLLLLFFPFGFYLYFRRR